MDGEVPMLRKYRGTPFVSWTSIYWLSSWKIWYLDSILVLIVDCIAYRH